MKKSMSDNFIKSKMMKIISSKIFMENFIWGIKTQSTIIQMRNYMIGRWKTMKLKKEDVGPSNPSQKNQHINVSLCPSYQIYSEEKLGNTLLYAHPNIK